MYYGAVMSWARRLFLGICCASVVLAAGCTSSPQRASDSRDGSISTSSGTASRVLRLASREEPKDNFGIASASGAAAGEFGFIFSAGLTVYDHDGLLQPRLAQKVPRVEDGDWQIFPDGTMEVTWRLRPDAVWHDGTPLTAADYELSARLLLDRDIPRLGADGWASSSIAGATAIDRQTLVIRWKQAYLFANMAQPSTFPPVPQHLVGDLYQTDKQLFINSPYWTTEYVGVGPYRLVEWVQGSHISGEAFDRYVLGRPKASRITIQLIPDPNAQLANVLAGEIDVLPPGNIRVLELRTLKDAWDPVGGGTAMSVVQGLRQLLPQFRDPNAAWARDPRIREAFVHMLDRQTMADVLQLGFTVPADSFLSPRDPTWRLADQRGFPHHTFDLAQAQRLMGDAGWTRGSDGLYRDARGQLLALQVRGGSDFQQEITVVAAQFKDAGLESNPDIIPDTTADQRELQNTFPGVLATSGGGTTSFQDFDEFNIGTAENRWQGRNRGAYRNPLMERLTKEWASNSFEESKRLSVQADIVKLIADEVVSIPLYYNPRGQAWTKLVRGPGPYENPFQSILTWNIHEWEVG